VTTFEDEAGLERLAREDKIVITKEKRSFRLRLKEPCKGSGCLAS